ncbi:DNA mismatch repair protein MSH3 isoform X2 [Hevea brasiliensis]|uniref:DNA mismatch repair protein MSH3 isoform X2 n=1 Tax=Hevea brasiliensis TaxID=3981 RepID=UPI0025F3F734|nr:DNA mismatch repair protein MSH3 isoform X2 [Hevea brasiliensis]
MGKQKQQVISRFFAPKAKTNDPSTLPTTPSSSSSPASTPKISATVSFSPAKRKLLSAHLTSTPKRPKLSPHTQNPTPTPSVHQKFLDKLLESSPETSQPSSTQSSIPKKYTPLEQQVLDLKNRYPDVLLMVEVGYKYRFFGEDAGTAARVLGIYAHMDHNFMTASVPTFRLNVHVRRLVSAGYKVGVVKQTETAAIKAHGDNKTGPFCRGLSALYTKATMEAAEDVGGREEGCGGESNYLCCVVDRSFLVENADREVESGFDTRIGFMGVEISTGDVVFGEFNDVFLRSGLEAVVLSLSPAELLLGDPLSKQTEKLLLTYAGPSSNVRVERASRDCFNDGGVLAEVMSSYENMAEDKTEDSEKQTEGTEQGNCHLDIEGIMNMPDLAMQALALTIRHLKQFGLERILCLGASFRPFSSNMEMNLSANTLQQLEVTHPLCDRNMISARLDAVSEIAKSMGSYKASQNVGKLDGENSDVAIVQPDFYYLLSSVLTTLGRSPDIQRGITRIYHRTATASEFISVMQAILHAGKQFGRLQIEEEHNNEKVQAKTVCSVLLKKLIFTVSSSSVVGNAAKLLSTLNKEAAERGDIPNLIVISNGQFPEVASSRKTVQLAKEKLDSLICLYRKQLKMHNLEFMSVSGNTHLIELPTDVKVPLNWVKVNSTKKTIRYHPPEVLTALDQLSLANEELMVVSRAAWDNFLRGFGKYYAEFQAVVQALAALDCLHSLACLSKNKNYVRPMFVDDSEPVQIHISSGRHPVLETILQDSFVPNDTHLDADGEHCQIVTGPNMGGKSCYIRQVGLIAMMAQVGSFVPASSAKLHVLDAIYTRMGASDSIQQGRSTFLEELSEASDILHKCTARSLVIMDELGRGTSTHDGEAIAYATLHHLLKEKRCMVLFVTHYPKIADVKTEFLDSVGTYHVSYLTSEKNTDAMDSKFYNENVTYLYKLVPGVSERSFAFKVAQLAQLPSSCIRQATIMAAKLELAITCRTGSKLDKRQLLGTLQSDWEQETRDNISESSKCFPAVKMDNYEELSSSYQKLFMNLKSAVVDGDPAKSWQFLENARSVGKSLLTSYVSRCRPDKEHSDG